MNQQRIRELLAQWPAKALYPSSVRPRLFQSARPSPAERFALALQDPAFGRHFVDAHLQTGHGLPATVHEWPLLQSFLAGLLKVAEPVMVEVESFRTESRRHDRQLLEALLLAKSATLATIAGHLNTSEEVVEAYENLFWNVRDRWDDRGYINSLLHPAGVQATARDAQPNPEGDRLRLLRAGAPDKVDEVLVLAGHQPRSQEDATGDEAEEVRHQLERDALRRVRVGSRLEDPIVRAVHAAESRRREQAQHEDPLALHNLSSFHSAMDEVRKHAGIGGERGRIRWKSCARQASGRSSWLRRARRSRWPTRTSFRLVRQSVSVPPPDWASSPSPGRATAGSPVASIPPARARLRPGHPTPTESRPPPAPT